tara:strand:+ start:104 stop:1855 length:1752 start_codon:yes stop_codon:yes gene_type:complete
MVRYLLNPVSSGDYDKIERNLPKFLNYDFMENASEQTPDMKYDKEEYKKHVDDAYRLISEMDIRQFLEEHVKPKIRQSDKASFSQKDLDFVLINLGESNLPMKEYLTSSGFDQIIGARKTGETSRKIRNIAESKAMYEDALKNIDKYIDVTQTKNEQKAGGAGGYLTTVDGVREERPASIIEYDIVIDTEKMFNDIFKEAGISPQMNLQKSQINLDDVLEDYQKQIQPESDYQMEIKPDMPTLQDLSEFKFIWFPKDLRDEASKDSQLAEKIIKINMKLIWNEDRSEYEMPYDTLDEEQKNLLFLLFNTNVIKIDSIYKYVKDGKTPSNRSLNKEEVDFLKTQIQPRAKTQGQKPSFVDEYEQKLWSNVKDKVLADRRMDVILHAPEESKYKEIKLFKTPINYSKPVVNGKEGLLSVRRNDSSKVMNDIIKSMLNPSDIGLHTLKARVIQVDEPYVKLGENYLRNKTMPSGGSSKDNKKIFRELLDEKWNVFRLIDADYKSKARPFLSDIEEAFPQRRPNKKKLTDVDYERMKKPITRPGSNPVGSAGRVKEGGQVKMISVKSRVFNSSIKRQLRRLKRYVNE